MDFSLSNFFKFSPLIYFVIPFSASILLTIVGFRLPGGSGRDLTLLLFPIFVITVLEIIRFFRGSSRTAVSLEKLTELHRSRLTIIMFGWIIFFACALDLYFHGIVILNSDPNAYSTFTSTQAQLRHFSLLCWTLGPIFFLPNIHRKHRFPFLAMAILFPILALDRNRVLSSFAAIAMMFFIFPETSKNRNRAWLKIFLILFFGAFLFSKLGAKRVGDAGLHELLTNNRRSELETKKYPELGNYFQNLNQLCPRPNELPVKKWFSTQHPKLQWILTYITSPIFNFVTVSHCNWQNSDYLKAQIIPLWARLHGDPKPLPLVSPYLNVASEFMPFYLAGGMPATALAFLLIYFSLNLSAYTFCQRQDFFLFLIFMRLAYCAFTANFAPQFFIWTTFGFILLCGFLSKLNHYSVMFELFGKAKRPS